MKTKHKKKQRSAAGINRVDENILSPYLKELNRLPVLTRETEEALIEKAARGDLEARNSLVSSNLRFVVSIAKKYRGRGLPMEDLINEGNLGLLRAVETYDREKGCRFISYGVWWVRQSITRALNEKGRMIRIPSHKSAQINKIKMSRWEVQNAPGWEPDLEDEYTARFLHMSSEDIKSHIYMDQDVLSLDAPAFKNYSDTAMIEYLEDRKSQSPEFLAERSVVREKLDMALSKLNQREAEIIRDRFGLNDLGPMSLSELGNRYDLSRERIRQIELKALKQLRKSYDAGFHHGHTA
ncbi:MAG: RNA polymerase sigma factor RpoD/SigA [Treponema sp.]|nr:RNA polymerase sigma factor RpoD/SigA [Treponema sp.]